MTNTTINTLPAFLLGERISAFHWTGKVVAVEGSRVLLQPDPDRSGAHPNRRWIERSECRPADHDGEPWGRA